MTFSIRSSFLLIQTLLAVVAAPLLFPSPSFGAELRIRDAEGVTRAAGEVSSTGALEFNVTTLQGMPSDGEEISLFNTQTGDTLATVSSNGLARFESVPAGTWTVTSASDQVVFAGIMVMDEAAAGLGLASAGAMGLSGTGAAAAAVGAGAIGIGAVASAGGGGGSSLSASQ
jgi:hypothetical protein